MGSELAMAGQEQDWVVALLKVWHMLEWRLVALQRLLDSGMANDQGC